MADPKKPKQLSEASPLDEFTATGNLYVDPAYTSEEATPAVSPITGEALVFGENTLSTFSANNNNSPALNPEDGHAIFVSNIKRGTARSDGNHFFFGFNRGTTLNDIYITNSTGGDFSTSPRVAGKYIADSDGILNVYIEGSTFGGNLMGFGSQTDNTQSFTGDYEFTIKNSTVQWFCITYGTGNGLDDTNAGNERYGTFYGNIDLLVEGTTVTANNGAILRGAIHSSDGSDKAYIRAYIKDSNFGSFGVIQNGVEGGSDQYKSEVDVDITVENTTFRDVFLMFPNVSTNTQVRDGKLTITGDVNFKATNTSFAGLNMGAGLGGTGWNRTGWIKGDINFNISGSSNSSRTFIHKGFIGTEDEPNTVTGSLTNSVFGDFTGYDTRENNYIYADTTVRMTASTIGNFVFYNTINSSGTVTPTADRVIGTQKLELAGVRAGNVAGNGPGANQSEASFDLQIKASETQTQVGVISNWDNITIDAGANVRATSISLLDSDEGRLTIAIGSSVVAGSIADITTLYVSGELVEADTVIISGLGEDGVSDSLVLYVGDNEVEYTKGIFPGYYDVVGGDLIIHNASSTVLLVNSNYTNGEKTDLGPKGYTTVANAQTAVTDKTTTTIMVYGMDDEVEENVFTADVVTKDYSTSFVGESGETVSLDGYDIIVGDEAADVDSANVSITYTDNINAIKFGNVSGTAKLAIDHAGDDEESALGTLDLTGVNVGDAQISVDASVIENVKLADQVEFFGSVTIKNSTITNVYGGAGANVTNDLTGGNVITNVFAEGNSDKIKLGTSTVETYMAGLSEQGAALESLTYNDSVSAKNMIIGGNANTIGNISATFNGGEVENLAIGGDGDTIGDINLAFNGGKFEDIIVGENATVNGGVVVTFNGGTVANINGSGDITTSTDGSTFYGLIYGASVTGELDGGEQGDYRLLVIDGHVKVGSVKNFDSLTVTGGTLNVASGDRKSEVSESNSLDIDGNILNYRTINAGVVSAQNLVNYGAVGTLRDLDDPDLVALSLSGNLINAGVIMTASAEVDGDFTNYRKITALGDITVDGAFTNSGDIYFYATSSREGVFTQEGGLVLNDVDLFNTGFISAGKLTGVNNLVTDKLYVTGGAEIDGDITIEAGAEVAFTNKANPNVANGLTLGGSIYMGDTSRLVVSGDLTTSGTKTITVDVGDLIGAQEIVRAEGGVNSWTVKLTGENSGMYSYVKDEYSVTVYSTGELYVNSSFSEDGKIVVDGNTLAFGKNAFASVADAVAAAKSGAKIVIINDATGMDVSASAYDVELVNSTVGAVTAKNILVSSDSTIASIAAATGLTIEADALLTITDTIAANLPIVIDATAGSGSRLILDVDPSKVTLSADQVTILGKDTYSALVLAGEGEGAPVHAGDLFLISQDNAYYAPSLFKTVEEVVQPNFVDGDTFDAATGDALFAGVNTFSDRAEAVTTAKDNGGIFVIFDNVIGNKVGEDGVTSLLEVDAARGDDGQTRALVGVHDDGNTPYVSSQDHTTMIVGSTSRGNVYGLSRWFEMDGDFTFIAKDSVSTGSNMYITGNNYNSVMNGDINATIVGSTFGTTYIGYGNFGTWDFDPIDVNVTISDSRTGEFRGINISGTTPTTINANINISVYDSMIGGAFYGIGTADWVAAATNIYQSTFLSGSINVEVGGTTVSNQFRPGDSIPHGANALQTFNVPTTLHVVATEKSAVTRADWVMEWDTIIIDADATLQVNNGLEYVNAYKSATDAIDNGGQLIQIYVNMSGYAGGTRTVITTGFINTDENMSNISVIGDNDMTGQRQLVYGTNTSQGGGLYHLDRVAIFDKADDMYVNADYTEAITGTTVRGGQELYFGANAHADFGKALEYATEWGGTIVVTGGEFDSEDFDGNNVELQKGSIEEITMGTRQASTLKVLAGGTFDLADGSGVSTLDVDGNAVLGDVEDFAAVSVDKGAEVAFGAISGSNIELFADSLITADSLNFSDKTISIDVTNYLGKAHTVISTENGITGSAANINLVGTDADKYGIVLTDDSLVLTTTIKSDTFLNADYTEAITGTILADGTYLQYGFNAFNNAADAVANLGSTKNTVTVTGGTLAGDIALNGANFVIEDGAVGGYIYGATDDDFSGMNIAIDAGSVGGISLVSADGLYSVSKAAITFADGISVDGVVAGAGDTTISLAGNATVGGIEDVKQITLTTSSYLAAGYIDLNGGTVYVTGGAVENKEGNLHKVISTEGGITGASYACDPGLTIYASSKDVYLMDLTRIYFNPSYTEAVTGTTAANGDTLQWGSNAFADLTTAMNHVVSGGTLYVSGYSGDVVYNSTADAISLNIDGGRIGTFRVIGADRNASKINHPVSIDIDGATLTAGIDYILGRSNSYDNVNNSLVYYAPITINLSNGRNNDNLRFVGQWDTIQSGVTMTLTNWTIDGDFKPFFGDARAADNGNYHSFIDVTFDKVTVANDKWITLANVTDWGQLDYINLTIKDSTIRTGTGGNNMRIGAFDDGNEGRHNHNTPITFTVENSHVNAMLAASNIGGDSSSAQRTTNYQGTSTLNVLGSSNYIKWANWFQAVNMSVDTYLAGGTITFRPGTYQIDEEETIDTNGIINIDATGYTGASKILINLESGFRNVEPGSDSFLLNLTQDADDYALVAGNKALVIWDGNVTNLFYNPAFTSNAVVVGQTGPNGEILVKTVFDEDEEIKVLGNAYGEEEDYDELVGFEDAKKALAAGNTLYITGGTFMSDDEDEPLIYGTIADEDETAFVNLSVLGGLFSGISIAEDGKTVTGDALLELAGGTFGIPAVYETPEATDDDPNPEPELVEDAIPATISGSQDSVDGTSTLLVSSNLTITGEVVDFDVVQVKANVTVTGDFDADIITIDASRKLTVGGDVIADTIIIDAENYNGPTRAIAVAGNFDDVADQPAVTILGDLETYDYRYVEDTLYLVSKNAGNVYLNAEWDESISGTVYNGELLVFGVNAFNAMDEAILKTTSDYTMYILGGVFNEVYDLTGIGQVNLNITGGTIGGFIIGDGADSDHRSTVRINDGTATSAVSIGSLAGIEGSTIGYRVIANKDAAFGTIDGIRYFRFGAGANVTVNGINYIQIAGATEGLMSAGELVVDFAGYTAGAGVLLQTADGIANLMVPTEFLADGTAVSRVVMGANNNADMLMPYYDEQTKAIVAAGRGEFAFLDADANSAQNGTVISIEGKTTTQVYGYNLSNWNVNAGRYAISGGTLFADGGEAGAFYWFFTAAPISVNVTGITTGGFVAGYNDDSAADQKYREGDFTAVITATTFTWFAAIAGQGNADAHQEMVVAKYNEEDEDYEDVAWNITISNSVHSMNDFRIARYANLSGGTINVTISDYDLRGDLMLFDRVFNGHAEGHEGDELEEVNVTLSNVQEPVAKWIQVWEPQESNSTKINLTIIDTNLAGDNTSTIGLFGVDTTGTWSGEADVYISGVTIANGNLNGGRGQTGGGLDNISGTRRLHVVGGTNRIATVREFNSIEIADGALLTGTQISMSEGNGFILRGEAGYTGDAKVFAVVGTTITGVEQDDAQFLDEDDYEIDGYKAVVGATNVFIYKLAGDVYYDNTYTAAITGTEITEADGSKNFLVYGDNAVSGMKSAYASVDEREGKATIQVMNASGTLYTFGYKTVVNGGVITNVVGGTNYTTTKVDSGEVDPETGDPIMVDVVTPAEDVDSVDITIKSGATVTNVRVASEYSQVSGDALITIADGVALKGTLDGGSEFVGGESSIVFEGNASAKALTGFDSVTLTADGLVTITDAFAADAIASITIDATDFADFSKKVLVVEGGFGDVSGITVNVIGGDFGYEFLDDGKTLLVTSNLVGNVFANTAWTEADVHDKFVGDMALVWDKNAFNSFSAAAAAIGSTNTFYIEGGASSEDVVLGTNDVVVSGDATSVGSLSSQGGVLTVQSDFTAGAVSGFSAMNMNAGLNISVDALDLAAGSKLTIDVTGYQQSDFDAVVLTAGTNSLTTDDLVLVGEGAGVLYAYVDDVDKDVHLMRVDNFYVDVAYGTAGQNIEPGQVNPITGEKLLFGVNAFYYLNDALGKMAPGQSLYINNRQGNNVNTSDRIANIYLTNSTVPVIINGFTTGDQSYVGDVWMRIENSTFATAAGSFLFGDVTVGEAWNHNQHIFGSMTVDVTGSTMGGDTGAILVTGFSFVNVYGTEEAPATITFNFTDSIIRDDILFIGDSPLGKTEVIGGQTYTGADLVINMENVSTPQDKWWRIQGGDQGSEGTVTVNLKNSTFGDNGGMRFSLDDNWGTGWGSTPHSASDFIFNLEDVTFKGYLLAGRLDYGRDDSELTTYTGAKTLNISGDVAINNTYWFKELNLTADATFTGGTLRMATTGAKINIDVTGYTGPSKVFITMDNAFQNVTVADINLIGLEEGSPYTIVTDYDPEAEAPAITAVVLKGAIKDIYVNSDYTAEDFKLGTSYNGEALFFGENAFSTVEDAIPALTVEGAGLFVTGGKVKTAVLPTNSLTIDATAQLTYNGTDVITIDGILNNEGTLVISAAGFIGNDSDIVVLTATAITGEGTFKTDNNAYMLNLVGNELHLVAKKVDVFVNTAWSDLEAGSVVEIAGGTAIIGEDAFATADAAAAAVVDNGTITILASDVSFTNAIVRTVIATAGSVVNNASVGTGTNVGTLTLQSGAVATTVSVRGKGVLSVEAGATVTGGLGMLTGAQVTFAAGSVLDFDISAMEAGADASVTNFSLLTGSPDYTITLAANQALGVYSLATDAASFNSSATLMVGDSAIGSVAFGSSLARNGFIYTLGLTDNNVLSLTIEEGELPDVPSLAYVNSEWAGLEDGTTVTVGAISATIGYDAFADLGSGIAGVTDDGSVLVAGGEVSFANGYYKTIAVGSDATVVGTASFLNRPITINGTMAFDVALTTRTTAQFADVQFVSGDTQYSLTFDNPTAGVYMLASGLWYDDLYQPVFNGSVTFGDAVLTVGNDVTIGDFTYGLRTTSNLELMLVVDKAVAPATDVTFLTAGLDGFQNMIGRMIPSETAGFTSDIKFYTLDSAPWGMTLGIEDGWTYAGVGDFNGDGKDDILRYNTSNGLVVSDNSNGNGTFTPAVLNFKNASWDIIGTGDFNGDGTDDVLVANRTAASASIGLLGYWANGTTWTLINGYSDEWTLVDTGDYDGNGCTDMLWKNSFVGDGGLTYNAYCTWRLGDIEGLDWSIVMVAKVNETETPDTDAWSFLATGDFNGDGIDDIAMVNDVGMVAINAMAADGTSLSWTTLDMIADGWSVAGVADLNLDGTDDMILCTEVEGVGSLAGYWQITADEQTGHPTNSWKDVGWLV